MPTTTSLVRDIFDQIINLGNLAIVDELVSVDAAVHIPGWGMPANRLGFKQMIANLRAAFPDLHCSLDDEIDVENKLAAIWTLRGTHKGSFFGNLPTDRWVDVQGLLFATTKNGQITEGWLLIDQMSVLQQIGVVPPP